MIFGLYEVSPTYCGNHIQAVHVRVDKAPALLSTVGLHTSLKRSLQLILKVQQGTTSQTFPLVLIGITSIPERINEVPLDPLHATLVEIFKRAFNESNCKRSQAKVYGEGNEQRNATVPGQDDPPPSGGVLLFKLSPRRSPHRLYRCFIDDLYRDFIQNLLRYKR